MDEGARIVGGLVDMEREEREGVLAIGLAGRWCWNYMELK
jgi:hypothetical protein